MFTFLFGLLVLTVAAVIAISVGHVVKALVFGGHDEYHQPLFVNGSLNRFECFLSSIMALMICVLTLIGTLTATLVFLLGEFVLSLI